MSNYPKSAQGKLTFSKDGKRVYGDYRLVASLSDYAYRGANLARHLQHAAKRKGASDERSVPT